MMLHIKYQGSRPYGFKKKKEDFSCFPYVSLCKTCDPQGGVTFGHGGGGGGGVVI